MERKSGFKECPRCGLRNKPSAAQCDFCGWEFRDVSDEWISHVQVLEKLNRATESIVLDDEVSRRIESTIVRSSREVPEEAPAQPPPAPPKPAPAPPAREAVVEADARVRPKEWTERKVTVVPPAPPPEDNEVKAFVETMIGEPVTAQAAAEVTVSRPEAVFAPVPGRPEVVVEEEMGFAPSSGFLERYHLIFLGVGAGFYAIALALYALSYLSVPVGWGLAIAGAALITLGVSHFYDTRVTRTVSGEAMIGKMHNFGDEVIICPRCHEEVSEDDDRCPSCGAAFSR